MKIVDKIKYEGDNKTFIYKYPEENFNTLSRIIVDESQEALFYLNGRALDLMPPGEHALETNNIPLLSKVINIPTDGVSPFSCHVYFINKTEQMAIKWGMGNVNFLDPTYNNYAFKIGASGEMSLRIGDSRKIITKLVGTEQSLDQETIKEYFRTSINMHIKSMLPKTLKEMNISIFEVESHLSDLSNILKENISKEMDDYGIVLEKFWINTILVPENDPYYITLNKQRVERITIENQGQLDMQQADIRRKIELINHTGEIQRRKMDIDTERYKNEQLGITEIQKEGFDVLKKIAENEGTGSDLRNAAIGLGTGFGIGGVFGNALSNISNSTMSDFTSLGKPSSTQNDLFNDVPEMIDLDQELSLKPSVKNSEDLSDFKKKIEKIKMMKEAGILSEEEFIEHKMLLLNEIKTGE